MILIRPLQEAIKSTFGRHCSREQAKSTTGIPKAILGDQSDDQSQWQSMAMAMTMTNEPTTGTPKAILSDQSDDQSCIQLIASKDITALGSYLVSDSLLSSSVKLQRSRYFFFVENMPRNFAFGLPQGRLCIKKSTYLKHCQKKCQNQIEQEDVFLGSLPFEVIQERPCTYVQNDRG